MTLDEILEALKAPFSKDAAASSPYLSQTERDIGSIGSTPDAQAYAQRAEDDQGMRDYGNFLDKLAAPSQPIKDASPLDALQGNQIAPPAPAVADESGDAKAPTKRATASKKAEQPSVKELIAKKYGFDPSMGDDALRSAQALGAQQRYTAGMGGALATIANALAGNQKAADLTPFQEMAANSTQPAKDIQARREGALQNQKLASEQETLDPNSPKAQMLRNTINRLYPGQFKPGDLDNLAAGDFDKILKPLELKESIEARKQMAADNRAWREMAMKNTLDEKVAKRAQALGDALDPDKARSGNFGQQQNIVYSANKIAQLAKQFPGGNMPPAQVAELAQATANMLSNGSGAAEGTINRYVPSSLGRDAASLTQWLTGKPQGAEQQAFVKQMLETADREKNLAQQNVNHIKFGRVAQFDDLRKKDPQAWAQVLQSHEVDPAAYDQYKQAGFKMPEPAAAPGVDRSALEAEMRRRGMLK